MARDRHDLRFHSAGLTLKSATPHDLHFQSTSRVLVTSISSLRANPFHAPLTFHSRQIMPGRIGPAGPGSPCSSRPRPAAGMPSGQAPRTSAARTGRRHARIRRYRRRPSASGMSRPRSGRSPGHPGRCPNTAPQSPLPHPYGPPHASAGCGHAPSTCRCGSHSPAGMSAAAAARPATPHRRGRPGCQNDGPTNPHTFRLSAAYAKIGGGSGPDAVPPDTRRIRRTAQERFRRANTPQNALASRRGQVIRSNPTKTL